MSLFESYETKESKSSSETTEVRVSELSAPINGEYGQFRVFTVNGKKFTIDNRKVVNASVYRTNAEASLTLTKLESGKIVVGGLQFHLPTGSGLFLMQ